MEISELKIPEKKLGDEENKTRSRSKSILNNFIPKEIIENEDSSEKINLKPSEFVMGMVKSSGLSSEDQKDIEKIDEGTYTLRESLRLISKCRKKHDSFKRKANIFKFFFKLKELIIIAISFTVTIISAKDEAYVISVLAALIVTIGLLSELFQLDKRGIYLLIASLKFVKMKRIITSTMESGNIDSLRNINNDVNVNIENIELNIFSSGYASNIENNIDLTLIKNKPREDEDEIDQYQLTEDISNLFNFEQEYEKEGENIDDFYNINSSGNDENFSINPEIDNEDIENQNINECKNRVRSESDTVIID